MLAAYSIASETATINHHPHLPTAVAHLQNHQLQHHLNKQQVQSHHQALLAANSITGMFSVNRIKIFMFSIEKIFIKLCSK